MIGAEIFALTGQVAELAGRYFPLAFFVAAIVTAFSAYSYIKMSNAYPSAGGIAMYLEKAYGRGAITRASAILMALSMVINESLVARTFGTYALQLFDIPATSLLVPALGVGLIIFAFIIMRLQSDPFIAVVAGIALLTVFIAEWLYLRSQQNVLSQNTHKH